MNEEKAEVLLVIAKRIDKLENLPEFMNINGTCVMFTFHLGTWILLLTELSLHQHVMNVCMVAYIELRHINSI